MNKAQQLWWEQSRSDFEIFELLRQQGVAECHALHYLQMATEKLGKAAFWANNEAPAMKHVGFAKFLRRFGNTQRRHRTRVAALYGFTHFDAFQASIKSLHEMARQVEQISPAVDQDGPNSEYPWPHTAPIYCPASYAFPVWKELKSAKGRKLMRFVATSIRRFPEYASL